MAEKKDSWDSHIKPHGEINELYPGKLWMVQGTFGKKSDGFRNMVIYKMEDEGLLCHSPVCLNKEGMDKLESLGTVKLMIAPNGQHTIDTAVWKERYPEAILASPAIYKAAFEKEKSLKTDMDADDLSKFGIKSHTIDGIKQSGGFGIGGELAYEVKLSSSEHALIVTDILFNVSGATGIKKFFIGSSFEVNRLIRWVVVNDKKALKSWIEKMANADPKIVVVAHGAPVVENTKNALLEAAKKL